MCAVAADCAVHFAEEEHGAGKVEFAHAPAGFEEG